MKIRPSETIICVTALLISVGVVMVYSTAASKAIGAGDTLGSLTKQLVCVAVGVLAMAMMARANYRQFYGRITTPLVVGVAVVLLVMVLIPGVGVRYNGARRWLGVGPVSFQPSEFAKLAVVIGVAAYATFLRESKDEVPLGFLPAIAGIGLFFLLIVKEPDFGTAVLVLTLGFGVLFIAGLRVIFIIFMSLAGIPVLIEMVMRVPYRAARFKAFIDPWADPHGTGYHLIQSLIALGSGGLTGTGLGGGRQKLHFLPESHADFIFAVLAEETGFIGAMLVIILFAVLVWQGMKIAINCRDQFGRLVAFGVSTTIGLQALINVAVVTGSIPTKGIALPFISQGGSSLVITMASLGILLNIAKANESVEFTVVPEETDGPIGLAELAREDPLPA